jgi:hypothetical protein
MDKGELSLPEKYTQWIINQMPKMYVVQQINAYSPPWRGAGPAALGAQRVPER